MVPQASASSLWEASRAVLDDSNVVQGSGIPVEKIADDFARDMAWVVGTHAADLYSTAWAINNGAKEGNPLGPTAESRIALKMAGSASTGLTLWKLRRDGHGKTATIIRWVYVAMNSAFVINNSIHAVTKR